MAPGGAIQLRREFIPTAFQVTFQLQLSLVLHFAGREILRRLEVLDGACETATKKILLDAWRFGIYGSKITKEYTHPFAYGIRIRRKIPENKDGTRDFCVLNVVIVREYPIEVGNKPEDWQVVPEAKARTDKKCNLGRPVNIAPVHVAKSILRRFILKYCQKSMYGRTMTKA
ncbi:hypothetical protein BDQ17DRAFT_1321504 [Cyathus striatus]|nr:hypothetical protein BDQ17DRAFT_1321504 [Cyathus striatus]